MKSFKARSILALALFAMGSLMMSCSGEDPEDFGSVSLDLQLAAGITVDSVNWTVTNAATSFSRTGTVNVRFSNTVSFQIGSLPSGTGYSIALSAVSVGNALTCAGTATFDVTSGTTTAVNVDFQCSTTPVGAGKVVVTGTTQICATIEAIDASPLETTVNNPIALAAVASAGSITPTYAWSASAGTFDNAAIANPTFTCPPTAGPVTITLTVSPGTAACRTLRTDSVTVTCDTLNPTFTNVYTNIIGARCTGCHRVGGGGFTVGRLDMSTRELAYANLVGVAAQGTGAGTSGITCSSVSPALTRVVPSDSANSLLLAKVRSKLLGMLAPCGSPMPTPATAAPIAAAQVDLIQAWIDAGAMND